MLVFFKSILYVEFHFCATERGPGDIVISGV